MKISEDQLNLLLMKNVLRHGREKNNIATSSSSLMDRMDKLIKLAHRTISSLLNETLRITITQYSFGVLVSRLN